MKKFKRILVANRGEIALKILMAISPRLATKILLNFFIISSLLVLDIIQQIQGKL